MIRAPWWTLLLAAALGALLAVLYLRAGTDSGLDELRAAVTVAETRADSLATVADQATAIATASWEQHAADTARANAEIRRLTTRVQTTTARATALGDSIRAHVGEEAAGWLADLETEWQGALDAEAAKGDVWEARALSAEAGWADARLALVSTQEALEAERRTSAAQMSLVRALEATLRRANRDRKLLALAAVAGVAWGVSR